MSSTAVDLTCCPICLDIFISPKALPCLHTFCELCLHEYIRATVANARGQALNELDCPTCRRKVPAPSKDSWEKWAEQFVLNHMMVTLIDERKRNDPVVNSQIDEKMKSISLESKRVDITPTVDEDILKPGIEDKPAVVQDDLMDEELQMPPSHHYPPFYRGHRRGHRHPHGPPPLHPPPPHLFGPPRRHRPPFGPPPHEPPSHWPSPPPPPHGTHPNFPRPPHGGPHPHWQPPRQGHHHIPNSGRGRCHHPPPL